tara:strand:+ start:2038 stop:2394 length:357 start_codon:yes stop_codon:yes gene_type:complete
MSESEIEDSQNPGDPTDPDDSAAGSELSADTRGIDQNVVRSIPITLNVEVGTTELKLKDLMAVAQGTVLELNRGVGDLMDIKVNGSVIAKGEVVTVQDNKLGVRVLEIVSPMERVRGA